jgi:hypothetical protein
MKKFLIKIAIFNLLLILGLILGFAMPVTPVASKSYFFSSIQKDSLLANVASPRMIFIGGSNISFGLNSQMIRDSLNVNPINTGINAGTGLKYMLDNTVQYIKEGDIIVAPLEYAHYTHDYNQCGDALLRIIMDVNRKGLSLLSLQQAFNLLSDIPKYLISKFKPTAYLNAEVDTPYSANSFNEYGDECAHWNMENRDFIPSVRLDDFNRQIIDRLKDFEETVRQKGARFYIAYPSYMEKAFRESEDIIEIIRNELEQNFAVLGYPARYMMSDSLMFDTSYHLNKTGVDIRTVRLIEDIKGEIEKRQ